MRFVAYGQFAIDWFYDNRYEVPSPKSIFIATKEMVEKAKTNEWIHWYKSHDREFYTTPTGLVLVVDKLPPIYESIPKHAYDIPDPDWLYKSLKEKEIMDTDINEWAMLSLYYCTKPWKEKQAKRDIQYELDVSNLMYEQELPFTDEMREATKKVMSFDYKYHLTDDETRWRKFSQMEKDLIMTFTHHPKMLSYFTKKFKLG